MFQNSNVCKNDNNIVDGTILLRNGTGHQHSRGGDDARKGVELMSASLLQPIYCGTYSVKFSSTPAQRIRFERFTILSFAVYIATKARAAAAELCKGSKYLGDQTENTASF